MKSIVSCLVLMMAFIGCTDATGPGDGKGHWALIRESQSGRFFALSFADQQHGWAVGDSGRIITTSDGGDTWNAQESGTTHYLRCVRFVTQQKGWIAGGGSAIGATTDGGASWTWKYSSADPDRDFMAMSFPDERNGWIADNFGRILHTTDGGESWTDQSSGSSRAITSIQFLDAREGWATGISRVVLHTTDGGNTWTAESLDSLEDGSGGATHFQDICVVNRALGFIATACIPSGAYYHMPPPVVCTTNAGETWSCRATPEQYALLTIAFLDGHNGWAAGYSGVVYTNDGGANWSYQLQPPGGIFVDLCIVGKSRCYALTFTGGIFRFTL